MRADMFKVIVERPRWGAGHAWSPKVKRSPDPGVRHIGLKRHAYIGTPFTNLSRFDPVTVDRLDAERKHMVRRGGHERTFAARLSPPHGLGLW